VQDTPKGVLVKPVSTPHKTDLATGIAAIRQRITHKRPAVSMEDMNAAVLREAARRSQR